MDELKSTRLNLSYRMNSFESSTLLKLKSILMQLSSKSVKVESYCKIYVP